MNVIDHGRPWGARDSQTGSLEVQYRDPQGSSAMAPAQADGVTKVEHVSQGIEVSSTTETTRAGVQVDPKLKRKRVSAQDSIFVTSDLTRAAIRTSNQNRLRHLPKAQEEV
jgi:hypothetical protein